VDGGGDPAGGPLAGSRTDTGGGWQASKGSCMGARVCVGARVWAGGAGAVDGFVVRGRVPLGRCARPVSLFLMAPFGMYLTCPQASLTSIFID
jgi:hypothetical protein